MSQQSDILSLHELDAASLTPAPERPSLLGATREDLEAAMVDMGEPTYRGRQLFKGLFNRRVNDFADLTDLSKVLRAKLQERFNIDRPRLDGVQVSTDGTRKYRFIGADDSDSVAFESVYIPGVAKSGKTHTLCISSQTGCAVGCRFCFTASLRRNRNLAADEIIGQVLAVRDDVAALDDGTRVTNIVFMGMGEPLLNYEHVLQAIHILVDPDGLDFSTRRVTVSTAGIVPRIHDLGRDTQTQLAISLNATTDEVRDAVMPINRKWPLAELIGAMRAYPLQKRRRITVEYVLLGGVNDSPEDAYRLIDLLEGIPVKVNLLPLNAHDRTELKPPTDASAAAFQKILMENGMTALRRTPRGQDIAAACGQLGESLATAASD